MQIMMGMIFAVILIILIYRYLLMIRGNRQFSLALLPLLDAIDDYLKILINNAEFSLSNIDLLKQKKEKITAILFASKIYPEWVFSSAYNPALRSGCRFFLLKLELVIDLLFNFHYDLIELYATNQLDRLYLAILSVMTKNHELLNVVMAVFTQNTINTLPADYIEDIELLENEINEQLPLRLSLVKLSDHQALLIQFMQRIKDLRAALLSLVSALPAQKG